MGGAKANAFEKTTRKARPERRLAPIQPCPIRGQPIHNYEKITLHFSQRRASRSVRTKNRRCRSGRFARIITGGSEVRKQHNDSESFAGHFHGDDHEHQHVVSRGHFARHEHDDDHHVFSQPVGAGTVCFLQVFPRLVRGKTFAVRIFVRQIRGRKRGNMRCHPEPRRRRGTSQLL